MKNKGATFLLGGVVLIVWGMIFLKLINSWRDKDSPNTAALYVNDTMYNDYAVEDSFKLQLNYRDPFMLTQSSDNVHYRVLNQKVKLKENLEKKVPAAYPISYSGYVVVPGSKKVLSILNVNGMNMLMQEGESKYSVQVLKNLRDSVKVSYHGRVKYLPISSAE